MMKQFLLSCLFFVSALFSQAQVDFNDGQGLPGWSTTADLGISPYSVNSDCGATDPGGLTIAPFVGEPVRILSPALGPISNDEMLSLIFNYFTFNGSPLTCASQVNSSCVTITAYLVDASYAEGDLETLPAAGLIYGQNTITNVATGPAKRIDVPVTSVTPVINSFKLLLDINLNGCSALVHLVDNLNLTIEEQTTTPVSFKSFTANREKSTVALNWITASEQNNRGFYVQKNEGNGWKDVAFVFSQAEGGNSAADLEYAYDDVNISKGITQYRLMQVDIDGKAKLSEIRSARGEDQTARVLVYPNPSNNGSVNVVFDTQSSRDVQVSDISGRMIKKYSGVVNNLKIEGLRAGIYTLRIADRTNGATIVEKVVVK